MVIHPVAMEILKSWICKSLWNGVMTKPPHIYSFGDEHPEIDFYRFLSYFLMFEKQGFEWFWLPQNWRTADANILDLVKIGSLVCFDHWTAVFHPLNSAFLHSTRPSCSECLHRVDPRNVMPVMPAKQQREQPMRPAKHKNQHHVWKSWLICG